MFRPIPLCSSRLKYSSHVDQLLFSSGGPVGGNRASTTIAVDSVVMPCLFLLSIHGSTNMLVSEWLWTSINPGLTKSPSTSMTLSAFVSSTLPILLIRPRFRPISALNHGLPAPSQDSAGSLEQAHSASELACSPGAHPYAAAYAAAAYDKNSLLFTLATSIGNQVIRRNPQPWVESRSDCDHRPLLFGLLALAGVIVCHFGYAQAARRLDA